MRLIATYHERDKAIQLSTYLNQQSIVHELDIKVNNDWGSSEYGLVTCHLWVVDEDDCERALQFAQEFASNPDDARFRLPEKAIFIVDSLKKGARATPRSMGKTLKVKRWQSEPLGPMTLYLILLCTLLYFWTAFTAPSVPQRHEQERSVVYISKLPLIPQYYSKLKKDLLFDYPAAFQATDKLINIYGYEKLLTPEELPPEGKMLWNKALETPYWKGIYDQIVAHFRNEDAKWDFSSKRFEKISQGEWWRLISPALLHGDLLHLLFNMIWLAIVGKQLEQRMGRGRYILFIAISAIVSNTAQYFMSGVNFLGFSGVICSMIAFVWVRQRYYAWEGYLVSSATMAFIAFFLIALLAMQLSSFFIEVTYGKGLPLYFANTAHFTGLAIGALLGRMNFFRWKSE